MTWMILCLGWALFPNNASAPVVSETELHNWITYLASDEMQGRANGTPELDQAADWIAQQYETFGLAPAPGQADFFQSFVTTKPQRRNAEDQAEPASVTVRNVIGYLPGSDPAMRDEYIVLSAHYDHVGVNPNREGDQIMNGADDNASGVSTMLAVAASLHRQDMRPKRSVVFIAFGAEEWGLRGSRHYVANSPLSLDKMVVNLNFELTGHTTKLGAKKFLLTGENYSDLAALLADTATDHDWELVENPLKDMNLFFRSDNVAFVTLEMDREKGAFTGIPAHTLSTWGGEEHYHQPNDEVDIMNLDNLTRLIPVVTDAVMRLGNRQAWVQWQANDKYSFRRPAKEE